ncbi:amino acid ABC transporter substrate-binding protein [Leeia sp. TBRC 13508]|uniref:Amino acid ABC transporter substrate-binding protein n=1 Tax=Leeia speluncae TaxID=2884804 RepID=A0ABS8D6J4_9NEIS|nr:amino acid ABC transporter substrate-binding protein [Leeia speluncae]MCB6183830.1 amino acid ABC transporter substrate-binding protein [Leeia speluncae]
MQKKHPSRSNPMLLAVASASAMLISQPSVADATLDRILSSGQINLGHFPGEEPFSDVDAQKQPIGYSIDLCKRVVEDLSKSSGKPIQINWVDVVDAKNRFTLMDGKKIDALCADTTNNRERQKKYSFSYTMYVAGIRLLSDKSKSYKSFSDLRGKKVGVIAGTTGEGLLKGVSNDKQLGYQVVMSKDLESLWELLEKKQVEAIAYDDILLANKAAKSKAGGNAYTFLHEYLSVEPYGIMTRKDDVDFMKTINKTLANLFITGEIMTYYNKWFMNGSRKIPLGHILSEDFKAPNNYPAYP